MADNSTFDPIPTDVAEFLAFFEGSLGEVRFPDVDRESLGTLAQDVRAQAAELARLEEQVRAAREALEEAQAVLRRAARRGLAYAAVYADGDSKLSARIAGLALGKDESESSKPPVKERVPRGRKPKEADGTRGAKAAKQMDELPFDEGNGAVTDAA